MGWGRGRVLAPPRTLGRLAQRALNDAGPSVLRDNRRKPYFFAASRSLSPRSASA
jgi:hypothetical protein